jgi:two-component system, NarL family, nitrate/nitrite response regulator NarL
MGARFPTIIIDMKGKQIPINIVVADDHAIFRDGLKRLLSGRPGFRVVGEAADGNQALDEVGKWHPDVLLLDWEMPGAGGAEVLRSFPASGGNTRVILLSGVIEGKEIVSAFGLGARGLVLKDADPDVLFACIHAVMDGQFWLGRQAAASPSELLGRGQFRRAASKRYGLTPRELQIIKLVTSGITNKEIADRLSISEQTVKHHVTGVFDKLGIDNRLELTLFVYHHELDL